MKGYISFIGSYAETYLSISIQFKSNLILTARADQIKSS